MTSQKPRMADVFKLPMKAAEVCRLYDADGASVAKVFGMPAYAADRAAAAFFAKHKENT